MCSSGINGEGELRWQPANSGYLEKWLLKWSVCVREIEVVVTTGAIRRAKLHSKCQNIATNKPTSSFLQAGCPYCHPTNSVKALKGNCTYL